MLSARTSSPSTSSASTLAPEPVPASAPAPESECSAAPAPARDSSLRDVTQGSISKQLIYLVIPVLGSILIQQTYSYANTFILGHFGTLEDLGGVQATGALVDLVVGASVGIGSGCAILCGQYFGAHKFNHLARALTTSLITTVVLGLIVMVGARMGAPLVLSWLQTPAELWDHALAFAETYYLALPFSLIFNTGCALLRAVGDTKTPASILALSCLFNIVFDVIFIAGGHLGAQGAGWANVVTLALSSLIVLAVLMRIKASWGLRLNRLTMDWRMLKPMLICGIPLGIQSAAYSLSNMLVQTSINSYGSGVVTAWGLSTRLDTLVWVVAESFGIALTAFAAQNYGAHKTQRIKRSIIRAGSMMSISTVLMGLVTIIFCPLLAAIFVSDVTIIAQAAYYTQAICMFYILYGWISIISGALRGCGNSVVPMAITLIGTCAFRVVWTQIVWNHWPTIEILLATYPVTYALTLVLFGIYTLIKGQLIPHEAAEV